MPLIVTASLSRKTSRDFQSSGTSITLAAEVDGSLINKPEELQREIARVFDQARVALESQTNDPPPVDPAPARPSRDGDRRDRNQPGQPRRDNCRPTGNGRGGNSPATESQRRAINAIATRLAIDPRQEAIDIIGVELDRLTLAQASEMIDHLKTLSPAGNGIGVADDAQRS